jgi:hypothetical protein
MARVVHEAAAAQDGWIDRTTLIRQAHRNDACRATRLPEYRNILRRDDHCHSSIGDTAAT